MKRFTYKASDATTRLAETQRRLAAARKRVADLEQEERNLKGFLDPYFDLDEVVDLEFEDGTVIRVKRLEYDMFTMDQERVKKILARLRKTVPYKKTTVQKMSARRVLSHS